jgi:chorismate mutase
MQRLRRQVDKIDLKLLKLLQQRTKLSGEIGRAKRRHGAEIYVPDRERELVARIAKRAAGKLPPTAVTAIFREILSSSRAAQGQPPIGLLKKSAEAILLAARWHFGACDRFVTKPSWQILARELAAGRLAVGLLALPDLAAILRKAGTRRDFLSRMSIVGEFSPAGGRAGRLEEKVFVVKPRKKETRAAGARALILIECKITANAVKSLLTAMPDRPLYDEHVTLSPSRGGAGFALLSLTFSKPIGEGTLLRHGGRTTSIVGIYPGGGDYGG